MNKLRLLLIIVIAVLCAWFYTNNMKIPFILTIIVGVIAIRIAERLSSEPYYDERDRYIALVASYITFFVSTTSIAALVIIESISGILGIEQLYEWSKDIITYLAPYIVYMFLVYSVSWVILRIKHS